MRKIRLQIKFWPAAAVVLVVLFAAAAHAQTTEFTYQGRISENNAPAAGSFDLEFRLFAAAAGGAPVAVQQRPNVAVANGVFTVRLDFGANAFDGAARFLEIAVRPAGAGGAFTTIAPRQPLSATPYAIRALNAETAVNALFVGSVPATEIVATTDARLSDARQPLPNSANYIQNRTSGAQTSANFRIDGTGAAGIFDASVGFNLNGGSFLRAPFAGTTTAVGFNAGRNSTTGNNTYVGFEAGLNTTGTESTFTGYRAGAGNTTGFGNSFYGFRSGIGNTTGSNNTFVGRNSGFVNTTGGNNTFIGAQAGLENTTGQLNVFVGSSAAPRNIGGELNVAIGTVSGLFNTTGSRNIFLGYGAGASNTVESNNTFLGYEADGAAGITNATAIGALARVTQSNSIALGALGTSVGIGTGAPAARLHVVGTSRFTDTVTIENRASQWSLQFIDPANAATRAGLRLSVSGFLDLSNTVGTGGLTFARLDSNGNWTALSDARMKKNVDPATGFLAGVMRIRPFFYNYIGETDERPRHLGFMAQDVERFFPSLVTNDEVKTLNYAGLSVVAIGALQEQQAEIEKLQEQNKRQQQQIEELKQIVCGIKPEAAICR